MHRLFSLAAFTTLFLMGCSMVENTVYDMRGLPPGKVSVVIDLADQHAYLYAGGEQVLSAPISSGREGHNTAPGKYHIIEKDINHRSSVYGAYERNGVIVKEDVNALKDPKPPGSYFVGAPMPYFLRIYGGVGMHQGYLPGYPASHGCIRMPGSKAQRFFAAVKVGTPVIVRR
ncbi:MAG TPA: L,D-transpeptidase family protein [Chthoniobacterales bacterium]|nr:L,D-transpeptidase family protein [Chthoniobacterales bacterium]